MKKILSVVAVLLMMCALLLSSFSAAAAGETLNDKNFREIYPDAFLPIEISDAGNGAQIMFHKIDSRVTLVAPNEDEEWGRLVKFNGLVMEFSGLNFPKPTTKTNGVTLAFTFSQEAGSFYATGSTGVHIRIFYTVDGMSIYMKSAPAPDNEAYYPMTGISWTQFPSRLIIKIFKQGSEYVFLFNEIECRVPADKIEQDISRSGDVFVNLGIMGVTNRDASLIVNKIYNDPSLTTTTAKTTAPTTATPTDPTTAPTEPATEPATTPATETPVETEDPIETAPVETELPGPQKMSADAKIAKINGGAMTITAKKGTTVEEFVGAFTIDEGYDVKLFDAADNEVASGTIDTASKVKVVGGSKVFAEFALELTEETETAGMPGWVIIVIIAAAAVVIAAVAVIVVIITAKKKKG